MQKTVFLIVILVGVLIVETIQTKTKKPAPLAELKRQFKGKQLVQYGKYDPSYQVHPTDFPIPHRVIKYGSKAVMGEFNPKRANFYLDANDVIAKIDYA